jgi:hypothetical protein
MFILPSSICSDWTFSKGGRSDEPLRVIRVWRDLLFCVKHLFVVAIGRRSRARRERNRSRQQAQASAVPSPPSFHVMQQPPQRARHAYAVNVDVD